MKFKIQSNFYYELIMLTCSFNSIKVEMSSNNYPQGDTLKGNILSAVIEYRCY